MKRKNNTENSLFSPWNSKIIANIISPWVCFDDFVRWNSLITHFDTFFIPFSNVSQRRPIATMFSRLLISTVRKSSLYRLLLWKPFNISFFTHRMAASRTALLASAARSSAVSQSVRLFSAESKVEVFSRLAFETMFVPLVGQGSQGSPGCREEGGIFAHSLLLIPPRTPSMLLIS